MWAVCVTDGWNHLLLCYPFMFIYGNTLLRSPAAGSIVEFQSQLPPAGSTIVFMLKPHFPWAVPSQRLSRAEVLVQAHYQEMQVGSNGLLWREDSPKACSSFLRTGCSLRIFLANLLPFPLAFIGVRPAPWPEVSPALLLFPSFYPSLVFSHYNYCTSNLTSVSASLGA